MNQTRHTPTRTATLLALGALALPTTACGRDSDASITEEATASASFCHDAVNLRQAFVNIFTAAPAGDPQQLKATVTAERKAATGMAERAPEAVDDAVGDLADILNRLDDELAERDYDVNRLHADGASPIEDDTFDEAGEDLEDYLVQECGVSPLEEDDDE
jgi:hypothetical protein